MDIQQPSPNVTPTIPPSAPEPLVPPTPSANSPQNPKNQKMLWAIVTVLAVALVGLAIGLWMYFANPAANNQATTDDNKNVTLTMAVHWLEDQQINGIKNADGTVKSKGLQQYLDEYTALHPNVKFNVQQINYNEYANKLKVLNDSGAAPDIYQIYSPWGASYVRDGILDEPPTDIKQDIETNYISTAGPTIEGKIWGIPTEINNYALLYNKNLFKEAGITSAPKTWTEFQAAAKKLTKRDSKGAITQHGVAFLRDNDWQVVDPLLSLIFTNGGSYLSSDLKKAEFNSAAGVAALDAQLALFKDKSTDINGNFFDFKDGKVGMVIAPPWTKSTFAASYGDKFEASVGVAPFPYITSPATLQYSWFTGVMKDSANKDAAWAFLKWFTTEQQASGTTRYGDLLVNTIGAIPARKVDFESHKDVLGDFFTKVYVDQMKNSKAEPNVLQSSAIKAALMTEIQAAWDGKKTAKAALDDAAATIDKILQQNY